jgi:hypothetical protein
MFLFDKARSIDYSSILPILEKGVPEDISKLLWQPRNRKIDYLPVTTTYVQILRTMGLNDHLSIHQIISKGGFELVIFNLPWSDSRVPFCPLILEKRTSKIVGVMLPFNELHGVLSRKASNCIGKLGSEWVKFTFPYNFT